ncbi:mitochondrial mRNA pseudouridine synthase TRUB2 isoform X2 [Fukomys damarensis]|uniref:mitochondrial mRNA pseudouridine synthase TRUB2 isoform X2 n=1 Tax=Fukomys damarensis TaxID=885580 RepID=UPI00053FC2F0|nr:mitochondrial mRNA pseudouridine synthase TRUB2 isoform X2 [Fukomys damarensis]
MGSAGLGRLNGLFAVYKPPGLKWLHLRDTVEMQLLKGLNARKPPVPKQRIRFLLCPVEGSDKKELTLTATSVPTLTDHPLVRGPAFTSLKIGVGHRLDVQSSGVLGLHSARPAGQSHGQLPGGWAAGGEDDLRYSNLDLQSQEAYEMAVRGVIRPMDKSPMLISGIRCLHFTPPEFLLEVQCVNETQQQLRKLVHEIGLELKTTAICSQVRRTRDGFFTLDDALLRTQWDLNSIQDAIQAAAPRVATELENNLRPLSGTQPLPSPGWPSGSKDLSSALGLESWVGP